MQRHTHRRIARGAALFAALALAVAATASIGPSRSNAASAPTGPRIGMVCTTDANNTFDLTTNAGYIVLPDGATAFMWGYALAGEEFQHPGPVLCVHEGDTVRVRLTNTLTKDVSIAFPGQEGVKANGLPVQPQFDGGGALTSLTNVATAGGGTVTYSFTAGKPGSYLYQSGTNPELQVRMGLFGALVVRPAIAPGGDLLSNRDKYANNRADSKFTPEEEFLVLLSEIDPYLNQAVENDQSFDFSTYHPRYWLINGRGFPDSVADNFAAWLPSQPYGALARVHEANSPGGRTDHPDPGLARYLSVGTEEYPFHPHGNNGLVIARDGNTLEGPAGQDQSFEKFSFNIGPGQTWDVLFKWYDAEHYNATTNPVPVTVPSVAAEVFGMFYSGSPYLGTVGTKPPGSSTLNQCGEYWIIAHNHALYQITSWGTNMSGPITFLRVDPPTPNNCPA